MVFAVSALAQPQLTTIQDTLYKADGTRFSGLLIISWNSFETDNLSNIVSQTLTVKVVDGNFRVRLVPTTNSTPPIFYNVKYNSDGKIQFEETWAVGAVSTPLRIRDVRVSVSQPSAGPVPPSGQTPIQETDVVGLSGDLDLRPIKGPGFSPGRAAFISASGAVEAVVGNPSDCVLVDGTAGPCGSGAGAEYADSETPAGAVDGSNAIFALAGAPTPAGSLALFRNGILQQAGSDFALAGSTIQFLDGAVPQAGDTLTAGYRLPAAGGLVGQQSAGGAEITCSAAGGTTSATNFTSLGTCVIGANVLQTGDRVEIHFDLAHQGTATGFEFKTLWGQTVLVDRIADAAESMIAGKGEAGIYDGGAQLRGESWGTTLAYAAGVSNATDLMAPSLTINFQVKMQQATSETVALRNFTVVRYPAQ